MYLLRDDNPPGFKLPALRVPGPDYSFFLQINYIDSPVFEGQIKLSLEKDKVEPKILIQNSLPTWKQRLDSNPNNYQGAMTHDQKQVLYDDLQEVHKPSDLEDIVLKQFGQLRDLRREQRIDPT